MRQEQFPQAAESFRKALAASPQDAALLNDYGFTQARMGDLDGASVSINKALEIAPTATRFANNLANVRYDAGDTDGALGVLMQHNKPAVAHFNMAYLHFRGGNYAAAKAQISEVLKYESLGESDSSVALAVSRSRDMLTQMDSSITRIAQAAPGAIASVNQVVNTLATPAAEPAGAAATPPTGSPTQAGGAFTVPPGVFDQPLR